MSARRRVERPGEVFLSHASRDRKMADRLAGTLRANQVPVWYSQTNLVGGQQWHDEIGWALDRCDWFLLLLSPAAVRSRWVKQELVYALGGERYENHILPVLFRECDHRALSWTLPSYQFVDFTAGFDRGCQSLLKVWGLGYQP